MFTFKFSAHQTSGWLGSASPPPPAAPSITGGSRTRPQPPLWRFQRASLWLTIVCLALSSFAISRAPRAAGADPAKIELRVLYAGNPGSDRMADFKQLLEQHFTAVGTADYSAFNPADADNYDVVIFDWTSIYPRDENGKIKAEEPMQMNQPTPPALGKDFARPTILIGGAGGTIANTYGGSIGQLAINWKCLCAENEAHDTNVDHAIFQGPLPVKLQFHERDKPADYFLYPGTQAMGEKISVWTVHARTFPEIDPGLVSTRESFTHTPDAEAISGAINGKGPTSVGIGRHGNFLLWGFAGAPADLTEAGRNAFLNAVCYIDKFDGQKPGPPHLDYGNRDSLRERVYNLRSTSDAYVASLVDRIEATKDMIPPAQLAQLGDDPAAYFKKMMEPMVAQVLQTIPQDVRDACGDDSERLIAYYDENLEYLRGDSAGGFVLDEDAKALGVSNRSPELLEACIKRLEAGEDVELARRVLERYTDVKFETAAEWRRWFNGNRDQLKLIDLAGKFAIGNILPAAP
jgi:hypothetical protein